MPTRTPPRFDRSTLDLIRKHLAGYGSAAGATEGEGDPEADALVTAAARPLGPVRMAPVVSAAPAAPVVPVVSAVPGGAVARGTQLVLPTFGARLGSLAGTAAREAPRRPRGRTEAVSKVSAAELPDEVVVVDTETTGIDRRARLVEIGALRVRGGVVIDRFQTLVDPGIPIPREVIRVHGITDAMVRGAPQADAALAAFFGWVSGSTLVAHNAGFDRRIFLQELARVGRPAPGLGVFCTLRMARKGLPGHPGYGLGVLAQALRIPVSGAHRALADCSTTVGLLGHLLGKHSRQALGQLHGPPKVL